MNSKKGNRTD